MGEELKQRLVGAIVLSALAVIFIPMLFDEAVQQDSVSIRKIPRFPGEFDHNPLEIPTRSQITEKIRRSLRDFPRLPGKRLKELNAWVVQVGSFAEKSNALELQDKLRKAGFVAFVQTADESGEPLFRVRVGPELNRDNAEKTQKQIQAAFDLKGLVVSYP